MQSRFTFLSGLFLLIISVTSNALATSNSDFSGMYVSGSVDTQSQLFIMDDNTFCYTFIGGSLNLVKAGHWKSSTKNTINLQEVQLMQPIHPALAKNMDRLGPLMVGINLDGYTLSNAHSPVFAVSGTNIPPKTFRPIFPSSNSSWAQTYAFPLMSPEKVKYLYIGDVEVDKYDRPGKKLRITEYKLENFDAVRIGFNKIQSDPALNMNAELIENVLHIDGDTFSSRKVMTKEMITEVREQCIKPVLNRANENGYNKRTAKPSKSKQTLKPSRTFSLDTSVIEGEPIFSKKDDSMTVATDSIDELIESEKNMLKSIFELASSEPAAVEDFMQLTQSLLTKRNRRIIHLPVIVELYVKLLVKKVSNGFKSNDFSLSEKMFFNFMDNIYPATIGSKNRKLKYNLSVVASQGLILIPKTNNTKIKRLVFDELLGKDFNIEKQSNKTLLYNLACFYSLSKSKKEMLLTIRQARKGGKSAKQFMKDTDFEHYFNDPEFIKAVE